MDGGAQAAVVSQPVTAEQGGRGPVFLWAGFLATLIIFITAVVGATMLFARRDEG